MQLMGISVFVAAVYERGRGQLHDPEPPTTARLETIAGYQKAPGCLVVVHPQVQREKHKILNLHKNCVWKGVRGPRLRNNSVNHAWGRRATQF